jgi:hypothetical protein
MQPQYSFDAPIRDMLVEWVSGVRFSDLLDSYTDNDREAQRLTRFIEDYFAYRLPWGFSAYLRIAAHQLGYDDGSLPDDFRYFPSMVKFGVTGKESCWAMSVGVPSRDLAPRFAAAYLEEVQDSDSFINFVRWFSSFSEEDLAERFELSEHKLQMIAAKIAAIAPRREEFHQLLLQPGELEADVVGLLYEGRLSAALQVREGESLELRRDYGNPYDRNAIKVLRRGSALGFIERGIARLIAPDMDSGIQYQASVIQRRLSARPPRLRVRLVALRS